MGAVLTILTLGAVALIPAAVCSAMCHRRPKVPHYRPPPHRSHHHHHRHGHGHGHQHQERGDHNETTPDLPDPTDRMMVRLYVGSHEKHNQVAGSVPGVVLFDDSGERLAEFESKSNMIVPGGIRDFAMTLSPSPGRKSADPAYLHLVAGKEDICISAVAITMPDGTQQAFSGDELSYCKGVARLSPSRTLVGTVRPKCFWLEGKKSFKTTMGGLSVHLPDFARRGKKLAAYIKKPALACSRSPRLFPYHGQDQRTIKDSIYIFNPPLEYEKVTEVDKDPSRILNWASRKRSFGDQSDQITHQHVRRANNSSSNGDSKNNNTAPAYTTIIEVERIRTEAPRLLVSDGEISAQTQCLYAEWELTDFVSLQEKLYCDMQSRTLVPICEPVPRHLSTTCFDMTSSTLKGFNAGSASHLAGGLASHMQSTWSTTGPLVGYQYSNISYAY